MQLQPIEYRGQLVALAGPERFHIVAPWLRGRPPADPELRFVAYMCLCRREAEAHGLTARLPGEVLEAWTRSTLIDARQLRCHHGLSDAELAGRLNVPAEQVALAREELYLQPKAD